MTKLKFFTFFTLFLIFYGAIYAQSPNRNERRGNRFYQSKNFQKAIDQYLKALDKDEDNAPVKLRLAESYRMINQPEQAAGWYGESIVSMEVTPENKLHYAQVLYSTGNYDLAETWTEQYLKEMPKEEKAKKMLHSLQHIDTYFKDSAAYAIQSLSINTPVAEFAPAYYMEGLVFASSRVKESAKRKNARDEANFLDLFYAKGHDNSLHEVTPLSKRINSRHHEGPATFFDKGQKMIFTRNNYGDGKSQRSGDGVKKLLFYAENYTDGNDWTNINPLPFNRDQYSIGYPSMDEEGTTLYFASDMPGGYGGYDIYVSLFVRGKWDTPKNLGPEINTAGDEIYPFIHRDRTLYFASNGFGGLGGMDIFSANSGGVTREFSRPTNFGAPVNSSRDDFALILDPEGTKGYFSSQRNGNDDIYSLEILRAQVEVLVLDQSTEIPMESVELKLYDGGIEVARHFSDGDGKVIFDGAIGKEYVIKAARDGYIQHEQSVSTAGSRFTQTRVSLESNSPDFSQADLIVLQQDGKERTYLANNAAQVLELIQDGNQIYLTDGTNQIALSSIHVDGQEARDDALTELLTQNRIAINETFHINPIYYNFDQSFIRKDASEELSHMFALLEKHQYLNIEIGSHTDSRGSDAYNEKLSQQRAEAVMAHLINQGIVEERLEAKGYSETRLVNKCGDGVACSAQNHQANRRTEFRIVGLFSHNTISP